MKGLIVKTTDIIDLYVDGYLKIERDPLFLESLNISERIDSLANLAICHADSNDELAVEIHLSALAAESGEFKNMNFDLSFDKIPRFTSKEGGEVSIEKVIEQLISSNKSSCEKEKIFAYIFNMIHK